MTQPANLSKNNSPTKQVIIYSHGLGVRYDARGMFTAIEELLPAAKHVMFDYNKVDEHKNVLTVPSVPDHVALFQQKLDEARRLYPDAKIMVVAHSFGCVVAGLADLTGVKKVILLAPPLDLHHSAKRLGRLIWSRLRFNLRGEVRFKRPDGTTVAITPAYRKGRKDLKPVELYNRMAENATVIAIAATKDRLLEQLDFSVLSPRIQTLRLEGNHSFMNEAREPFAKKIAEIISES